MGFENFKKGIKDTLKVLGVAGALSSAGLKTEAQTVEPYVAKDEKDFKYRKEMYEDSLNAYNQSQKSKKIYLTEDPAELADYYDSEDIDKRFNWHSRYGGKIERQHDKAVYTKYPQKTKPKYFDGGAPESREIINFEGQYAQFPVYEKPKQKVFLTDTPEADIVQKQIKLRDAGFDIKVDGNWGKKSEEAWSQYNQKDLQTDPNQDRYLKEILPDGTEVWEASTSNSAPPVIVHKKESQTKENTTYQSIKKQVEEIYDLMNADKQEEFIMPSGKKYTYEELIEAYPIMKNDAVFKRNFPNHKKPFN